MKLPNDCPIKLVKTVAVVKLAVIFKLDEAAQVVFAKVEPWGNNDDVVL